MIISDYDIDLFSSNNLDDLANDKDRLIHQRLELIKNERIDYIYNKLIDDISIINNFNKDDVDCIIYDYDHFDMIFDIDYIDYYYGKIKNLIQSDN